MMLGIGRDRKDDDGKPPSLAEQERASREQRRVEGEARNEELYLDAVRRHEQLAAEWSEDDGVDVSVDDLGRVKVGYSYPDEDEQRDAPFPHPDEVVEPLISKMGSPVPASICRSNTVAELLAKARTRSMLNGEAKSNAPGSSWGAWFRARFAAPRRTR